MGRSKSIRLLLGWIAIIFLLVPTWGVEVSEDGEGILHVEITGIQSTEGVIYVALWNNSENWLKTDPLLGYEIPADAESKKLIIRDLEPGVYALSVIHDENHNQEFDSNFLGIPIEPFGFSNNVRKRFGPVSYEAASFTIKKEPVYHKIEVKSLGGTSQNKDSSSENESP